MRVDLDSAPTARRDTLLPFVIVAGGVALLGLVTAIWQPGLPPDVEVRTTLGEFPEMIRALDRYWLPRYAVRTAEPLIHAGLAVMIIATRRGRRVLRRIAGPGDHSPRRAGYVAGGFLAAVTIVTLPLRFAVRVMRPGGEPTDLVSLANWTAEHLTELVAVWGLTGLTAALIAVMLPRWPRSWPWRLTILGIIGFSAIAFLNPLVIDPLTVERRALPEGDTRRAVEDVLERAGYEDVQVSLGVGRAASELGAYVSGVGSSRNIVVASEALRLFPPGSIVFVAAHELAHHEHHDVARGVLITATWLVPGLLGVGYLLRHRRLQGALEASGSSDPQMMAAVVAFALASNILVGPLLNAHERRTEIAADWSALQTTGDPDSAVHVLRFLVTEVGLHPDPPAWYQTFHGVHPEISRRIRLAVLYSQLVEHDRTASQPQPFPLSYRRLIWLPSDAQSG